VVVILTFDPSLAGMCSIISLVTVPGQIYFNLPYVILGPPLWPSGHSSLLQIRRPGFDSRHYRKKKSSESGTGSTQPREYN
jgi:hypothetical protein